MATMTSVKPHVRWMIRRDMPSVLDIAPTLTEEAALTMLRGRKMIGMVVEEGEEVRGFMIYELQKKLLHVHEFAVDWSHRRRGFGTAMIDLLKSKLSSRRRTRISINVRERNLPAQLFLKALGFEAVRVERDFYDDPTEDAYRMVCRFAEVPF